MKEQLVVNRFYVVTELMTRLIWIEVYSIMGIFDILSQQAINKHTLSSIRSLSELVENGILSNGAESSVL
jgi:predicted transcriptional regulator